MSQQMQLMYTERPCFGENKRTQKITQNTRKYILRRATKVTISKKKPCFVRFFLAGVTEQNDAHLQSFFARNAACRARKDGVSGHERARASLIRGQHQGFGFGKGGRVGVVGSCGASRDGVGGHERALASGSRGQRQGFGLAKGTRLGFVESISTR